MDDAMLEGSRADLLSCPGLLSSLATSGLSQLDFGVDRLEFAAGVADLHLPVDATLDAVEVARPSCGLRAQGRDIAEAAVGDALGGQAAQFVLRINRCLS